MRPRAKSRRIPRLLQISVMNNEYTMGGQKKVAPHYNTGIGIYNVKR